MALSSSLASAQLGPCDCPLWPTVPLLKWVMTDGMGRTVTW